MSDEIVAISGLTKRFAGVVAVDSLSFTARKGEILGLVGPDGAGKTTTLRILAGILPADTGSALVAGQDVLREPEAVKSRISYMPQQFGLYEDLTVTENIRFYADIFEVTRTVRQQREAQLLEASGMSRFRDRLAGQLSGGMKRKLGIACALIHTPQLLLLDEPTTGVDPVSRRELWSILYSLVFEGVTVLVSTAYLDEAERCHRLLLMHQGSRLFFGTPTDLKSKLPGGALSIISSNPQALQMATAGEQGVLRVTAMGDELHVVVDDPDRRLDQLRERFDSTGISFGDMRRIPASVEDVFVYVVSNQQTQQAREQ
jgi:ABC-2 type transport system ATP-binding protein